MVSLETLRKQCGEYLYWCKGVRIKTNIEAKMKLFSTNLLKEKSEGSVTVKTAVQNELHLNEWHLNSVVYVWTRLVTAVY